VYAKRRVHEWLKLYGFTALFGCVDRLDGIYRHRRWSHAKTFVDGFKNTGSETMPMLRPDS
jgi:hypothetical protein